MKENTTVQLKSRPSEFPVDVFPSKIRDVINSVAEKNNFPVQYLAASMLHAAAASIGNSYWLKSQWQEAAVLFMALLGPPGANKSHPIDWAYTPIKDRENELFEEKERANSANPANTVPEPGRMLLGDITVPALANAMDNNPRGVAILLDELAGTLSTTAKNPLILSLFNMKSVAIDRKSYGPIRIKRPFVPIIGTIQSNILQLALDSGKRLENGFIERMLWVELPEVQKKLIGPAVSDDSEKVLWKETIDKLLSLKFSVDENGIWHPNYLTLSPEAEKIIINYRNSSPNCEDDLSDDIVQRIKAKMDIYVHRFIIPLHLLNECDKDLPSTVVQQSTAESSVKLARYFTQIAFKIWKRISAKNPMDTLPANKLDVYNKLPKRFATGKGVQVAKNIGMAERSFKYWLATDTALFKRLGYGYYEKKYRA